jgi:hypothetical protein
MASMQAVMPGLDSFLSRVNEREADEALAFEDAAERAGCALTDRLTEIQSKPQHVQDRELVELVRDIYTGNAYGRSRLIWLLETLACTPDRQPSELVIRWHGGRP